MTGGLTVAGLVVLSAVGAIEWPVAVQLALSAATLAALAVTVMSVRRVDGKALRTDKRVKRQEAALTAQRDRLAALTTQVERLARAGQKNVDTVVTALGEDRVELAGHTASLNGHTVALNGHTRRLDEQSAALTAIRSALAGLDESLRRQRSSRTEYNQIEALVDLRALLQPRAPLPRLRGWAASPDVLRLLVERVAADRPKLIVECGSGASSVWLGYAVERFGGGRVVALEHDERFAGTSRDLIAAHGLDSIVEVRHAPLTEWQTFPWYDPAVFEDLSDAGLVFVDGPPEQTGPLARYPAVPLLLPHCAPDAWIVLDDTVRPDEREVAERWLREYPELSRTTYAAEKGAMIFRRSTL
ncbi:class I SAM-dependent methyltransferase [Streptosporangium sp. KLBMP 9127]|nr:class I SAM-dependent methyltransferase [Streptosporangium sp. KLBMP 9127]